MASRPTPSGPVGTEDRGRSRHRRWWPALTPLAVVAIALSLLSPTGRHQWDLSLFRQPTDSTALFFNEAWALPKTAVARAPLTVSFTIGNDEGRTVKYRYVLSVRGGGRTRVFGQSARTVAAGTTWRVATVIRPVCRTSHCQVEVSLPGYPETIYFLITLKAGRSAGRPGPTRHSRKS
jgi:hypothetical protein